MTTVEQTEHSENSSQQEEEEEFDKENVASNVSPQKSKRQSGEASSSSSSAKPPSKKRRSAGNSVQNDRQEASTSWASHQNPEPESPDQRHCPKCRKAQPDTRVCCHCYRAFLYWCIDNYCWDIKYEIQSPTLNIPFWVCHLCHKRPHEYNLHRKNYFIFVTDPELTRKIEARGILEVTGEKLRDVLETMDRYIEEYECAFHRNGLVSPGQKIAVVRSALNDRIRSFTRAVNDFEFMAVKTGLPHVNVPIMCLRSKLEFLETAIKDMSLVVTEQQ